MMGAASMVNRRDGDFPPIPVPVLHTDAGTVFVPHAFHAGFSTELPLSDGVAVAWTPCPEVDGALLVVAGGNDAAPTDESIAFTLSRDGLRALIGDLLVIDARLAEAR